MPEIHPNQALLIAVSWIGGVDGTLTILGAVGDLAQGLACVFSSDQKDVRRLLEQDCGWGQSAYGPDRRKPGLYVWEGRIEETQSEQVGPNTYLAAAYRWHGSFRRAHSGDFERFGLQALEAKPAEVWREYPAPLAGQPDIDSEGG